MNLWWMVSVLTGGKESDERRVSTCPAKSRAEQIKRIIKQKKDRLDNEVDLKNAGKYQKTQVKLIFRRKATLPYG
jgi:hypothetical protein